MNANNFFNVTFAHGGYVLTVQTDGDTKTEVFVSTNKLMKAIRAAVEDNTLVQKKNDAAED
jgi:histidinol phosphatase-like PHP family hydrolase